MRNLFNLCLFIHSFIYYPSVFYKSIFGGTSAPSCIMSKQKPLQDEIIRISNDYCKNMLWNM
jgi:hypothetical protein